MRRIRALALCGVLALAATSCSLIGEGDDSDESGDGGSSRVVLVTHESFVLPKKLQKSFEEQTGYHLVIRAAGDAGTLTNKLVLTKDDPLGDVSFGVDNTFASRALDAGVFAAHRDTVLTPPEKYDLPGDDDHLLVPIDHSNVCVNVDDTWFAEHDLAGPKTLDDLTDPAYRDLFVLPGATTSSTGMSFLLATIAEYGDDWPSYWTDLMDNGAKLTDGWSDAYQVDFTQGGGSGDRPIVLSYDSSPAFTVSGGKSTTSALLDTCFQSVEYAGVLEGAANKTGAESFLDFMLSPEVQEALPESMYVFPVDPDIDLPTEWAKFAQQPSNPYTVDPAEISEHRDDWLREWSDVTSR